MLHTQAPWPGVAAAASALSVALRMKQQPLQLELQVMWHGYAVSDTASAADSIPSRDSMCA